MSNTSNNVAQGYDRGKKDKSTTKQNSKVKDKKPGNKVSDQVEGIAKAQETKAKKAPKGQKQNAINSIKKSEQKERAVQKNLRNLQDVKDSYDD